MVKNYAHFVRIGRELFVRQKNKGTKIVVVFSRNYQKYTSNYQK